MDENTNVSQGGHSVDEYSDLRPLVRIIPADWDKHRINWLWNNLRGEEYAFDDPGKDNPHVFLASLFQECNECYEYGDEGYVVAQGIVPMVNANLHFAMWGEVNPGEVIDTARKLMGSLFARWKLKRITAMFPGFNKKASRFCTLLGFKYEGELRQAFLKNRQYHNLHMYGILREEFFKREVKH